MSDMSSDVCSSDLEYLRDRDSTDAQCQCRANMEPEPQHVEVRRVGVYRYVNELAGKIAERTPIGWNRRIAAIGVEQLGLELQERAGVGCGKRVAVSVGRGGRRKLQKKNDQH